MTNLFRSLLGRAAPAKRFTVNDYGLMLEQMGGGFGLIGGGGGTSDQEAIENSFVGYVNGAFKRNGPIFSTILARMMLFSEARFQFQRMEKGRPGTLFGNEQLRILEAPWPNGTTGELLSRMIQDADLAGNFYAAKEPTRLRRLRPDWVTIVLSAPPATAVASDVIGYMYHPGGKSSGSTPETYLVDEIVHWCPIPDPTAQYRGMSWISPIIDELQADQAATQHKLKFFENGAALQTVLTLGENVSAEQFKTWVRKFREAHQGVRNAYEPLFLGGGADAKVVGADLAQLDFKVTQGGGETRIASASGMHPVILGFSEGLAGSSLNAGNFNSARRLTADKTLRPLWRSACAALANVIKVPSGARLWFDGRDIAFLRDDIKDLAEVQSTEASSLQTLVNAGFEPKSVQAAVIAQDWNLLVHTGLVSVQLQEPGADKDGKAPASSVKTEAKSAQKQASPAEVLQKLFAGVGVAITADEARELANEAGASLSIPGPFQPDEEPEPEPVPEPEPADPDDGDPPPDDVPAEEDEE